MDVQRAEQRLVALSKRIDEAPANAERDREAALWGRVAKVAEEGGEAIAKLIGATGQNPRKGVTGDIEDVADELLDVAITALGAWEHIHGHPGMAFRALDVKLGQVVKRAAEL